MDPIRWGILGTGLIATKFAKGLRRLPDAELVAVGSRAPATAEAFGEKFGVPHRHASYEALAQDPDVDVIYVATPHVLHKENSLLCLQAGKAVLCEKPFTLNAAQAQEVISLAREKELFLMEAMWTRFLPTMVKTRQLLAEGAIGAPQVLNAGFGFRAEFDPHNRLFDPHLGGGALLDVGVYPVALAAMVFGPPAQIVSMAHLGQSGVDERCAAILGYAGGALALVSAAIRTETSRVATLSGERGQIRLHGPWWRGQALTLSAPGQPDRELRLPYEGNGYHLEAAEVMRCLRAGEIESDVMPLDETLSIMQTMDHIRAQWGLRYPDE